MSATVQTQINLVHLQSGIPVPSVTQRTSVGEQFAANAISVGTTDEIIPLGDVTTPKQVMVKFISGDLLRIGLDGTTYPFELVNADEATLFRLAVEGLFAIQEILAEADVGNSLDAKHFLVFDRNGEVKVELSTSGVSTLSSSGRLVLVTFDTDAPDLDVAQSIINAFASDPEFLVTRVGNAVTFTDKSTGFKGEMQNGDTGFGFSIYQSSANSPVIHLKSTGTSQVVVAVAPH